MSKWFKRILGLTAISGAIAGLVYYFKKSGSCREEEDMDDFEDEDFDLDNDLKPVSDREYVPLNNAAKEEKEEEKEDEPDAAADTAAASKDAEETEKTE